MHRYDRRDETEEYVGIERKTHSEAAKKQLDL